MGGKQAAAKKGRLRSGVPPFRIILLFSMRHGIHPILH